MLNERSIINEYREYELKINNENLIFLSTYDALFYLLDGNHFGKRQSYLDKAIQVMEDNT